MKNKKLILGSFFLLMAVQIVVPFLMILNQESIIKEGLEFKFKTAPIDPYDAFRGRYVWLSIQESNVSVPPGFFCRHGNMVYALITPGEDGFARLSSISTKRPQEAVPYIKAKAGYIYKEKMRLELPFDRYYMEEGAAPKAEKVYRQHSSRDKQDAYLTVKVKDGAVATTGLYVAGEKIEEAIKKIK